MRILLGLATLAALVGIIQPAMADEVDARPTVVAANPWEIPGFGAAFQACAGHARQHAHDHYRFDPGFEGCAVLFEANDRWSDAEARKQVAADRAAVKAALDRIRLENAAPPAAP